MILNNIEIENCDEKTVPLFFKNYEISADTNDKVCESILYIKKSWNTIPEYKIGRSKSDSLQTANESIQFVQAK